MFYAFVAAFVAVVFFFNVSAFLVASVTCVLGVEVVPAGDTATPLTDSKFDVNVVDVVTQPAAGRGACCIPYPLHLIIPNTVGSLAGFSAVTSTVAFAAEKKKGKEENHFNNTIQ